MFFIFGIMRIASLFILCKIFEGEYGFIPDYIFPEKKKIYFLPYENKKFEKVLIENKKYFRENYNKKTGICQKGLEIRIKNLEEKKRNEEKEKLIQYAFSRKIKSRRWAKRHHNWRYYPKHL
jgi:hypothetical protein